MNKNHIQDDENWDDPAMPEYTEMQKYAFITRKAVDANHVGYCYREYSDIKIDSGWRFLYGDEDEGYLDNPENTLTWDLSEVVAWKPALSGILSSRKGSEFEWNPETSDFEELKG
jgi:hypothetical protein